MVVLQHGMYERAERYVRAQGRLIPRQVDAGFAVLAPDLWGHGMSPGPRGRTHIGRAAGSHVEAREVALRLGLPVFLVGHSLGGLVTALSVTRQQGELAGVVLTSPAFPPPLPAVRRRLLGMLAAVHPHVGQKKRPRRAAAEAPDAILGDRGVSLMLGLTSCDASKAVIRGRGQWTHPTYIAHGTADRHTSPDASRRFYDALSSTDKTLNLVDGGGHELIGDPSHDLSGRVIDWMRSRG